MSTFLICGPVRTVRHSSPHRFGRAPTADVRATQAFVPKIRRRYLPLNPGVLEVKREDKKRRSYARDSTQEEKQR